MDMGELGEEISHESQNKPSQSEKPQPRQDTGSWTHTPVRSHTAKCGWKTNSHPLRLNRTLAIVVNQTLCVTPSVYVGVCALINGLLKGSSLCVAYPQRQRVSYADGVRHWCSSGLTTGSLCNFPSLDPNGRTESSCVAYMYGQTAHTTTQCLFKDKSENTMRDQQENRPMFHLLFSSNGFVWVYVALAKTIKVTAQ